MLWSEIPAALFAIQIDVIAKSLVSNWLHTRNRDRGCGGRKEDMPLGMLGGCESQTRGNDVIGQR